jgi:hypothetical protein
MRKEGRKENDGGEGRLEMGTRAGCFGCNYGNDKVWDGCTCSMHGYFLLPTYLDFKDTLQRLDELCVYSLVEGELRTSLQLKNGVSIFQFVLVMFI